MPLDPNIILGGQAPKFMTASELAQGAQSMRGLAVQNRQDQEDLATRAAYNRNVTQGADGTMTVNKPAVLSDLYKINPQKAIEAQGQFQSQDTAQKEAQMKQLKDQTEIAHQLAWSIPTDPTAPPEAKQAAWTRAKTLAGQYGLPNNDTLPDQYPGDGFVKNMQIGTMTAQEQIQKQEKDREFAQKGTELDLKHDENSIKHQQMVGDRDNKDAESLDKHLALGWTARSGQAGVVQGKLVSAEAAQQLIDQGKSQPGGLDSRQIEELAQSTGKLLGGGAAASARIDALVPHTLYGKAQSMQEYLTNNPTGAGQQAFVQRLADTVAREKALAENQKIQFQIEGLPSHARLKNSNPNLYNSILQAKGIDPTVIDDKGRYKAPDASPFHALSDDELDKAYKAAGGK